MIPPGSLLILGFKGGKNSGVLPCMTISFAVRLRMHLQWHFLELHSQFLSRIDDTLDDLFHLARSKPHGRIYGDIALR
jgi:hypothetical protein